MKAWPEDKKNKLISDAISFVKEGGAIAMEYFRKDFTIESVTKTDAIIYPLITSKKRLF